MHYIAIATALMLSVIAAVFSIFGLIAIFPGAIIAIAIMGSALEVAKVVSAIYLHLYWHYLGPFVKSYLMISVIFLMLVTSIGVFGYLSKAHLEQKVKLQTGIGQEIELIDLQIASQKANVDDLDLQLNAINVPLAKMIELSRRSRDARNALREMKRHTKSKKQIRKEREGYLTTLANLNTKKIQIESIRAIQEAEVGPIKYIANLVYGDASNDQLERAVRWLIIILVVTFDPLAIALLLGANIRFREVDQNTIQRILSEPVSNKHIKIPKSSIMRWR